MLPALQPAARSSSIIEHMEDSERIVMSSELMTGVPPSSTEDAHGASLTAAHARHLFSTVGDRCLEWRPALDESTGKVAASGEVLWRPYGECRGGEPAQSWYIEGTRLKTLFDTSYCLHWLYPADDRRSPQEDRAVASSREALGGPGFGFPEGEYGGEMLPIMAIKVVR